MRRFFVRLLPAIRTPSPLLPQRHIISSTSRLIRACGYYPVDRRRDMSTSQQPPQAASLSALHGIEFSSNTDPTESTPRLLALLGNPNSTTTGDGAGDAAGTKWALTPDKKGLQREFRFKTFKTTWVSLPFRALLRLCPDGQTDAHYISGIDGVYTIYYILWADASGC